MKTKRRAYPQEKDLEWYMNPLNWTEHCEVCKNELLVHALRGGNFKWKRALYAACHNKSCRNHYVVICFYL